MFPEKQLFIVPQKVVLEKEGKYLVLKRVTSSTAWPGRWDFPGGRIEHGEQPSEGMVREAKEETNLDVVFEKVLFTLTDKIPGGFAYLVVNKCKFGNGQVKISKDHSEFKWLSKKEILALKSITPALKKFCELEY